MHHPGLFATRYLSHGADLSDGGDHVDEVGTPTTTPMVMCACACAGGHGSPGVIAARGTLRRGFSPQEASWRPDAGSAHRWLKSEAGARVAQKEGGENGRKKPWKIILTAEQAIEIYKARPQGESSSATSSFRSNDVAEQYGVNSKTIRDIWNQATWVKATRPYWTDEEEAGYLASQKLHASAAEQSKVQALDAKGALGEQVKRSRGRPKGARDSRPRVKRKASREPETSPRHQLSPPRKQPHPHVASADHQLVAHGAHLHSAAHMGRAHMHYASGAGFDPTTLQHASWQARAHASMPGGMPGRPGYAAAFPAAPGRGCAPRVGVFAVASPLARGHEPSGGRAAGSGASSLSSFPTDDSNGSENTSDNGSGGGRSPEHHEFTVAGGAGAGAGGALRAVGGASGADVAAPSEVALPQWAASSWGGSPMFMRGHFGSGGVGVPGGVLLEQSEWDASYGRMSGPHPPMQN